MINKFVILDKVLSIEDLNKGYEFLLHSFDKINGGFGEAPKYIDSHKIMFLLKYYKITGQERALEMAINTLDSMYKGSMFDHIGYGFFNRSLDEKWSITTFEKTLYDNCFIIAVYLEAFEITKDYFYKDIANKSLEYVFRELKNYDKSIYCKDYLIENKEYYLFKPAEIISVLGKEDGAMFCVYYNITSSGNIKGKSIPNLIGNKNYRLENIKILELSRKILIYRNSRIKIEKIKNDFIVNSGLLLFSLAKAYRSIGDIKYLISANNIVENNYAYLDYSNEQLINAMEFSYFIMGLIELYEVSLNIEYLNVAIKFNNKVNRYYDLNDYNINKLLQEEILSADFLMVYNNIKLELIMKNN